MPVSLLVEDRCEEENEAFAAGEDLSPAVTEADLALLLSSPSKALLSFLRSATDETLTGAAGSGCSCAKVCPVVLLRSNTLGPDAVAALARYLAHQI